MEVFQTRSEYQQEHLESLRRRAEKSSHGLMLVALAIFGSGFFSANRGGSGNFGAGLSTGLSLGLLIYAVNKRDSEISAQAQIDRWEASQHRN